MTSQAYPHVSRSAPIVTPEAPHVIPEALPLSLLKPPMSFPKRSDGNLRLPRQITRPCLATMKTLLYNPEIPPCHPEGCEAAREDLGLPRQIKSNPKTLFPPKH